ncbi:MAG TPA: hypothetical protein VK633_00675, partial [Verrucomicrobiae bacterium]|nr:hypothetical protein [Verrucomicrobiae bacterium]
GRESFQEIRHGRFIAGNFLPILILPKHAHDGAAPWRADLLGFPVSAKTIVSSAFDGERFRP